MDYKKEVEIRCSRRTYTKESIEPSKVNQLKDLLLKVNAESGLHMQLYVDNGDAFSGLKMSYGMFKNVHNYIALVGTTKEANLVEKMGYFGEIVVLEATRLKLGTCWVGGTYDKKTCQCEIQDNETLLGIITVGYSPEERPLKERMIYSFIRRKTKAIDKMLESDRQTPDWITKGMEAVQKAPSAINRQPVKFKYGNNKLTAKVSEKLGYEMMDLGIAKLHFEIGSDNKGKWKLGNNEEYVINT